MTRSLARLAGPVVAIALAAAVLPVPATAATPPESDIPGIPLTGPTATGSLGGPIYDVVYSVYVPAGNVLLASLTGSPGTDFDLYLFDSTATSVLTSTPVARSKSGASSESISYPSRSGGTYYLDLNGASDVEGTYQLTVTTEKDSVAPTVVLRIQGGAAYIADPVVTLTVVAQDLLSGVDSMAFSTDGATWMPWQPYAPTTLWTFPGGDGVKRLWVRVRDRAGNVSAAADANTILDTVAPTVVSVSPANGGSTDSLTPVIHVVFSKSMLPVWWTSGGGLSVRPVGGGPDVPGTYVYNDQQRMGAFTPSVPLVAGTVYEAQLGTLYDTAGNRLVPYPAWSFTAKSEVPLEIAVTPGAITNGASALLTGAAVMAQPSAIEIQARAADATTWTTIASQFPDGNGAVRLPIAPPVTTSYRLRVAGSGTTADSSSDVVRLPVRTRITLVGLSSGVKTAKAGKTQTLLAKLQPASAGVVVTYRMYQWDATKKAWKLFVTAVRRTSAEGFAIWSWKHRPGRWYLRVSCAATATNSAGTSVVYQWKVS